MGTDVKSLEIPWWLQLSKRQILTFLPRLSFGTVRSEVRILSPRPINSSIYGYLQRWPFMFCGRIVANAIANDSHRFNRSSLSSVSCVRVTPYCLWIGMSHQIGNRRLTATRFEICANVLPLRLLLSQIIGSLYFSLFSKDRLFSRAQGL